MTSDTAERKKLLKRLKGFRAAMGDGYATLDAALRARIEQSTDELSKPKKVAIAGLANADHHDLAGFFVGADLVTAETTLADCPIIHITHGAAEKTHATFGEETRVLKGCQLEKVIATGEATKVDLELTTPVTADMNFTIMPIYDVEEHRTTYLFELLNDVDVLVWCSNAADTWESRERRFWFTIPDELKTRSILALTKAEDIDSDAAQKIVADKLTLLTGEFHSMTPISIDAARQAAPNGKLVDAQLFTDSGAQEILQDLTSLIAAGNQEMLERARAVRLELDAIPLGGVQTAPTEPVPAPLAAPLPKAEPKVEPKVTIEGFLTENVSTCAHLAQNAGDDYSDLFEQMETLLAGLNRLAKTDLNDATHQTEIRSQLAEARDLVGLFRYEGDKKAARDATTIVRQVCIDLWKCLRSNYDHDMQADAESKKAS